MNAARRNTGYGKQEFVRERMEDILRKLTDRNEKASYELAKHIGAESAQSDKYLRQRRIIERETAVKKKEPAEASPYDFGGSQSSCQRRAGSQNEIRQSE